MMRLPKILKREEGATLIETSVVIVPLFISFIGLLSLSLWLSAIATVTMDAITSNVGGVIYYNQRDGSKPEWSPIKLFINHPGPQASAAYNYAKAAKGFKEDDTFQLSVMNNAAGLADQADIAFGLTESSQGYQQIGTSFFSAPTGGPSWIGVERRVFGDVVISGHTLNPIASVVK